MAEQRAVCVPQCPSGPSCSCLYWARYADITVYMEVGVATLRGMGAAAGTALGAADARTNEHYEINAILTQFSHGGRPL